MEKKRVLLISMTVGEGHNQLAKTIQSSLNDENIDTKIIQLFGYDEKRVKRENDLFLTVYKTIPKIYGAIWHQQRNRNPKLKDKGYMQGVIKSAKEYILKQITEYKPDAIVTTHNNAGAVVNHLRENNLIDKNIKLYGLVFDYCRCPHWESNLSLDYIFLPHENLITEYENLGFNKQQILPVGIPVHKRYALNLDKQEIRKKLNLKPDSFVVVLYSGGNCISPNSTLIKELLKAKNVPLEIIAVCGKNEKEKNIIDKYIQKNNVTNIRNLGFTTNLDEYYSAADVVFSRGGGAGITEQINKHVPFILREKLITNEQINKELFEELGMGLGMKKISQAPQIIEMLYNNPQKLEDMKTNIKNFCRPNATKDITNKILEELNKK